MAKLKLNLKKILIDQCDILQLATPVDAGGQRSEGLDLGQPLLSNVPCRMIPYIPRGGGKERSTETRLNVTSYSVFIMPVVLPNGEGINEHLWLRVRQKIGGQWTTGIYLNITAAPPVLMEGAPLELSCTEVRP